MPEKVYLNEGFQIICVKSVGLVSIEDLQQSLVDIKKLKERSKLNKIFVDHTEATSFPASVPAFNFGADISRLFRRTSIALVNSNHAKADINFFTEVVNARGGNAQIFNMEKHALEWLIAQPI